MKVFVSYEVPLQNVDTLNHGQLKAHSVLDVPDFTEKTVAGIAGVLTGHTQNSLDKKFRVDGPLVILSLVPLQDDTSALVAA